MISFSFLVPLALTELFELSGAYLLGIRKKRDLLLILLVNMMTNPALSLCGILLYRVFPIDTVMGIVYWLLEPLIILFEGRMYQIFLGKEHPYCLSFILNMISITGGMLWNCFLR